MTQPSLDPTPQPQRESGCLFTILLTIALIPIAVAGTVWLFSLLQTTAGINGTFTAAYALGLLVPFGLAALLLRPPRFGLWRGTALALALAGVYAALGGGLTTLKLALPWQGVPAWAGPLAVAVFALIALVLLRRRFVPEVGAGVLLLGAAVGLLVSAGWVVVGALGTPSELALALLETLAMALASAAAVMAVFAYDRAFLAERPFWAAVLAGAVYTALLPGLLAGRGYGLQGLLLALAMLPAGFIAGALLAQGQTPTARRRTGALAAFFGLAYLLPFAWTEGFEGDWMFEEMGPAWGPAALAGLLVGGALAVILLAAREPLARLSRRAALPAGLVVLALLITGGLYVGAGQPGLMPESFFVVLESQADTSTARDAGDQAARYTAVYETLTAHALESQAGIRAALDEAGVDYTPYYLVNGLEVATYNPLLRNRLAAREDVWKVLDSPHTRPLPRWSTAINVFALLGPGAQAELAWGVDAIDAEVVWDAFGVTGEGIVVGIADSGVEWRHPALREQYPGGEGDHEYTWFDPWEGTSEPTDTNGHGTHTTGTVVGQGGIGVAPGAQWIACRNLGRNLGNPAYYLDCMQFLLAPHPQNGDPFAEGDPARGAHLTNNSWGCPPEEGCDGETLYIGVEHLRNAGQMFVVSAGNEGPGCSTVGPPATADAAFSVGAVGPGGEVTLFSSRGPVLVDGSGRVKPDVTAPGASVLSSVPGGGYAALDGTSMAGPHVAGLVALLWSADPTLIGDIDATEALITGTADYATAPDLCGGTGSAPNNVYGYGLIDADEAVERALGEDAGE